MNYIEVNSQNIAKIGYDIPTTKLHVVFKHDTSVVYIYNRVPRHIWDKFKAASSKGGFFSSTIKDRYSYEKSHISHN